MTKLLKVVKTLQDWCQVNQHLQQFLLLEQFIPIPRPHPLYVIYQIYRPIVGLSIERHNTKNLSLGIMNFLYTGALNFAYLWELPRYNLVQGQTYFGICKKWDEIDKLVSMEYSDHHVTIFSTNSAVLLLAKGPNKWVSREGYYSHNKGRK